MRHIPQPLLGLLVILAAGSLAALEIEGRFITATASGALVAELEQHGETVRGSISGLGFPVRLEAGTGAPGRFDGTLTSSMGTSWVQGHLDGDRLTLTVVDPDSMGRPDPSTSQRLELTRAPPSGALGSAAAAPLPGRPAAGREPPTPDDVDRIDPGWGFTFAPPPGWTARVGEGVVAMGSTDERGLILVVPHDAGTVEQLRAQVRAGVQEDGLVLVPSGELRGWGDRGVEVEVQGSAQGQPARGVAVSLVGPHGGGPAIMALVEAASWSPTCRERVGAIAASVRFQQPGSTAVAEQWRRRLEGRCLACLRSGGSSGPSYGGYSTGSGWSDRRAYFLYRDGTFAGSEGYQGSFDAGAGFGSVADGTGPRSGRWNVVTVGSSTLLELTLPSGQVDRRSLSTDSSGKTFVDGDRWFVVSFDEFADL